MAVQDFSGSGDPNGAVVANPGDTYQNDTGGSGNTFWVKESGFATDTGWVPMSSSSLPDVIDNPGVSVTVIAPLISAPVVAGAPATEVTPNDPAFPSLRVHGIPTQSDAVVHIADVPPAGSGFRIDAPNNGGQQVVQIMPANPAEWGIWYVNTVLRLNSQLQTLTFYPNGFALQNGVIVSQGNIISVSIGMAAGPGAATLSIGGFVVPPTTPGGEGEIVFLLSNYGGTADIILLHENAATPTSERIRCPGGVNFHIVPNRAVWIQRGVVQATPGPDIRWFLASV